MRKRRDGVEGGGGGGGGRERERDRERERESGRDMRADTIEKDVHSDEAIFSQSARN